MRRLFAILAFAAVASACASACAPILGEYEVEGFDAAGSSSGSSGGLPPECAVDDDCAGDLRCDAGRCRKPCISDQDCGNPYISCVSNLCSSPPGTACEDSGDCRAGSCEGLDNFAQPTDKYCTISCYDRACPGGFECLNSRCLEISGGQTYCRYLTDGGCARCAALNCDGELEDCCSNKGACDWVYDTIETCDVQRDCSTCNDLYYSGDPVWVESKLRECITQNCEGSCYNPPSCF